jgi:phage head maturation protease
VSREIYGVTTRPRRPRPPRAAIRSHDGATLTVGPAPTTAESLRAERAAGAQTITLPVQMVGHFAVTNTWTTIRSDGPAFLERIASGALRRAFSEDPVPLVMWNHGRDNFIGRRPLGAVRSLEEDTKGAAYTVDLFNTIAVRELLPALASDVVGASFALGVLDESWNDRPGRSSYNRKACPSARSGISRSARWGRYPEARTRRRPLASPSPATRPHSKRPARGSPRHAAAVQRGSPPASWLLPTSKPPASWLLP